MASRSSSRRAAACTALTCGFRECAHNCPAATVYGMTVFVLRLPASLGAHMNTRLGFALVVCLLLALAATAQDSNFSPQDQQIPVPGCLNYKELWGGGDKLCTAEDHKMWLADITHWRKERLI